MANKIRLKTGDEVTVIAGGSKGTAGKITSIDRKKLTVTVEGVAPLKKATKPSNENPQGGFVDLERPIHISNVMKTEKFEARAAKNA